MGLANTKTPKLTPSGLLQVGILSVNVTSVEEWVREYGSRDDVRRDDVVGERGQPPVLLAVEHACEDNVDWLKTMEIVQCLLKLGFSPNACGTDALGQSPIYMAARFGRADLLRVLISAGGNVKAPTQQGQSPIVIASIFGFTECVRVLLEAGADPNTLSNIINGTALHLAAHSGQATTKEVCLLLFKYGADVNRVNRIGRTPLHSTCESRRDMTDMIGFLLDNGASIDVQDWKGSTALMRAVRVGNVSSARYLLERGADVGIVDGDGMTARHIAETVRTLDEEKISQIFGAEIIPYQSAWNPE